MCEEQPQLALVGVEEEQMVVILSQPGQLNSGDKSAIYSHIARKGHIERRRRQSEQQSSEKQQRPLSHQELIRPHLPQSQHSSFPSVICPVHGPSQSEESTSCHGCAEAFNSIMSKALASKAGNSDPFKAHSVDIDANGSFYLDIGFQFLENVVWRSGLCVWCSPRGFVSPNAIASRIDVGFHLYGKQLTEVPKVVESEWASTYAYATLAYNASALFAATGAMEHATRATKYIVECIAGLRLYLVKQTGHAVFQPEQLIFRLIRAEIMAQNFASAIIHAKYLKELVVTRSGEGALDDVFVHHAAYQTTNLAIALWQRPEFKAQWLEQIYASIWEPLAINDDDVMDLEEEDPECSSTHIRLQKLLLATKKLFSQTTACLTRGMSAQPEKWYWLNARSEWLQICLLNFVHDQEAKLNSNSGVFSTTAVNMSLCLALATILSIRFQKHEPMLNQIPISPFSRMILSRLRTVFTHLESGLTRSEVAEFSDRLLWITFIAGLVEFRLRATLLRNGQPDRWWWQRLIEMIVSQRICTWTEMHQILVSFPYSADETPLPTPDWLDGPFESARSVRRLL